VGVVNVAVLACVLRRRLKKTKKIINFLREKSASSRENPAYAYEYVYRPAHKCDDQL